LTGHTGTREVAFTSAGANGPLAYADPWGNSETPDISGFATLSSNRSLEVLIYNHHDDWDVHGEYTIELEIANLPFDGEELVVRHERIDQPTATHTPNGCARASRCTRRQGSARRSKRARVWNSWSRRGRSRLRRIRSY
jgi:hypothetical protein